MDRRRPALLVAAAVFLGALLLRLWLTFVGPLPGDRWAQHHVDRVDLGDPWQDLGVFFSVIGTPTVAGLTVVAALWFVGRAAGIRGAAFVALACVGVAVNAGLKELSGPTPLMLSLAGEQARNFPSGHTVYAVVLFGSVAWLAWGARRWDIAALCVALSLAMGPFRVIAETHFVSDVIAGYLVGIGWLLVAAVVTGAGSLGPLRTSSRDS